MLVPLRSLLPPILLSGLVLPIAAGSAPATRAGADGPLFAEVGPGALPGVATTCGSPSKDWICEVNGGGLALGDFDGDGDHDLVVVDGSTVERYRAGEPGFPPRLFLNRGDATFEPAGEAWALAPGRWGMGAATGDLNGDGWLDLVVVEWGRDRVFLNDGGAGLRELERPGLAGERWGTSAALFDYDGDGVLDLAVANYLALYFDEVAARGADGTARWKGHAVMSGPEGLPPVHDQLYRGRGDGTFEVVSSHAAGFAPKSAGYALGLMPLDYDLDGDVDLYVANDSTANHLWENQGDGTFKDRGFAGTAYDQNGKEQAGMGIAAADANGDGRTDLFVTNFSGENNAFYVSRRERGFREQSSPFGLGGPSITRLGWGTAFVDVDLDGDLDVCVFNGHVYPQADEPGTDTSYAQDDQLYRRVDAGRFEPEALSDGPPAVSRAAAAADLDGDGDVDFVALSVEGPVRVLLNRTIESAPAGERPHWLRVRLAGRAPNTAGLGARVGATWAGGSAQAEVFTAAGFQAAKPAEAHFGLGAAERLERVTVRWPSGVETVLEDVAADQVLTIEEPE